jgi:hypothetical protein
LLKKTAKALALLATAALVVAVYNGISFQKRVNSRPLPSAYKKGVFHLHSLFSDGSGSAEEIARAAGTQKLDFVILTDHGRPNLQAAAATGWSHDTLLIGAAEFSLHAGHLAAAGFRVPEYVFPPEAQEAIDEVDRDNGVSFISHPLDRKIPWTDWNVDRFTGIEILSLYQLAKKNLLYAATLFPLQYLLNPDYALTALISYPKKEMAIWDRCNRDGKHYGIYALDAHAKLETGKTSYLRFPAYAATFRILTVYVRVERELVKDARASAAILIAALRRGDFFSVIESLAAANGFECYYLEANGDRVEMGGDTRAVGGKLVLKLPFQFRTDVLVRKDGEPYRTFRGNSRPELAVAISEPGVYRCEVSLHSGRFSNLPWILANPIFVARPAKAPLKTTVKPRAYLNGAAPFFQVEKNARSRGDVSMQAAADGQPLTRFAFTLHAEPGAVDFWTALARRENRDLSGFRGFVLEARGSRAMRFWLQFRTWAHGAETAYQHSFLVGEDWRRIFIPFERFQRLYGASAPPSLDRVSSFFILIDNGNSFAGAGGELWLRPIGLY